MQEAQGRGFIYQGSNLEGLDSRMAAGPITAYLGFDATAKSLHVGNLVQIMLLRLLQKHGHKPLVLMGGGTTRIGDPSFRDNERPLLDEALVEANIKSIGRVFEKFIRFGDKASDAVYLNNADWLLGLNYIDFLREIGAHFSVNRMLSFDSVRLRLEREQSLSFIEFNYILLQSYDFLYLHRRFGCLLECGGGDQWANIISGADLVRRLEGKEAFALTTPLLTTAAGAKMGKTASGAVWLDAELLAPFDYWQFWRNTHDADVGRFLRLFTELPLGEIARLEALEGADINEAKKILADEATRLLHGDEAVSAARDAAAKLFEGASGAAAAVIAGKITTAEMDAGLSVLDLLVKANLTASKGEARRLIRGGGIKLNDTPLQEEDRTLTPNDVVDGKVKFSVGKKKHAYFELLED
ncbi:MAG: tyrosine--tRNA ligase [Holosporales bacterium]